MECPLDISACGHGISRPYRILIPLALFAAYLVFLYTFLPYHDFFVYIGLAVAYLLPPAGKESVIPLGICLGEVWWLTALTCALIDSVCALFVVWNFDLLLRVPVFGPATGRFAGGGRAFIRARPWLGNLSYAGLILFVMFPLQGSGGVNATIIGRLLGMGVVPVLVCISAGSLAGCFSIAMGAGWLIALFSESPARAVLPGTIILAACA
ncbi:MAG: small multi-drug export protein [Methanomicrobiaceae archaeon]|nr:small multi-drug export protein [Methanomicrobiaceae archaeon]